MKSNERRLKYLPVQPVKFLQRLTSKRNAMLLSRLFIALVAVVVLYTAGFHYITQWEGHRYSVLTGLYWTVSTMTTLGMGDVALTSDLGRLFTMLVVGTGIFFLLVLLPFTTIQLFQSTARVPRELPEGTRGHVVLTDFSPLTSALIEKLERFRYSYVLLSSDVAEALQLRDRGIKTVAGELDDPETYREIRVDRAALVVASATDVANTSLAFAVRQVSQDVPIIATASGGAAVQILNAAGCTHVLALDEMMGNSLARRTIAGDAMAHTIGQVDELVIAEATAAGTPLVRKTLRQADLSRVAGVCVVGVWEGGDFFLPSDVDVITQRSVLVIAGSQSQIERYNELFCIYNVSGAPILIVGGGNVGRAMGRALKERELDFRIVEQSTELIFDRDQYVKGDATDVEVLRRASFFQAPAVAITTRDDATNIYLATFYRHLRKDIQIISRATSNRSVRALQAAGCDFVVSYASLGASSIFNLLKRGNILLVAEGVDVFKVRTPRALIGKTIAHSRVREESNCSIIGVSIDGAMAINPGVETRLPADAEIVLIGSVKSEEEFFGRFRQNRDR
jgi:voltage-gated potassium channel